MAGSKASLPVEPKAAGRPEDDVLIHCARVLRTPEGNGRIGALIEGPLDWDYLLKSADEHGVTPLLYRRLGEGFEDRVPGTVFDRLRGDFRANKLRNLFLAGKLIELYHLFERNGISTIPYKGPTLAASVYKNLALRQCGDLDMLIYWHDVPRAKELLIASGYEPTPWLTPMTLTPAQEAAFLRFEREYAFAREDSGISVELQWEVIPRYLSFSLDLEPLRGRLQWIPLGGGKLPTLGPEDLLLVLCIHGSKHLWERLIWIRDVAETVNVHNEMDWDALTTRAAGLGSKRMLFLGLSLAHDLLGARLPERVLDAVRSDPMIETLAAQVSEMLFREPDGSRGLLDGSTFHPFHYKMRERRRDRLGYVLRMATEPNVSDWMERPLPEKLFPLYYVLRQLRLAEKYGRRLLNRGAKE